MTAVAGKAPARVRVIAVYNPQVGRDDYQVQWFTPADNWSTGGYWQHVGSPFGNVELAKAYAKRITEGKAVDERVIVEYRGASEVVTEVLP